MTDQTTQPQAEPREYSLTELDNAVAAGQITQTQRDQYMVNQTRAAAVKEATAAARQVVETETRTNSLDSQLKAYANIAPDLMADGSPTRQRVASEYDYLVSQGAPPNLTTELAAVRSVMGPIERARAYKEGKRLGADGYQDSSGQANTPQARREADAWSRIDPQKRAYYENQINKGLYANRGAVLAEMNWRRGGDNKRGTA